MTTSEEEHESGPRRHSLRSAKNAPSHSLKNIRRVRSGGRSNRAAPKPQTRAGPKNEYEMPSPSAGGRAPLYIYIPKTAAPRRSSKTENVERSERTGRARETRHPSPPPATAGPHQLRRDWCLAHRLIRWTDPRTSLRTTACYPVALPVLGANLCCLLRLPVNIVFIVFIVCPISIYLANKLSSSSSSDRAAEVNRRPAKTIIDPRIENNENNENNVYRES